MEKGKLNPDQCTMSFVNDTSPPQERLAVAEANRFWVGASLALKDEGRG
jgi:hypothetical protein